MRKPALHRPADAFAHASSSSNAATLHRDRAIRATLCGQAIIRTGFFTGFSARRDDPHWPDLSPPFAEPRDPDLGRAPVKYKVRIYWRSATVDFPPSSYDY